MINNASSCSPVAKSAKTKITKSALVASSEAFELKAITSSLLRRPFKIPPIVLFIEFSSFAVS
ncbi:hypothetical protein FPW35_08900 [Campylobacter coli]|nr:hypothetical protein [Campylobacter jejuni]ECH5258058.1 hypothetical protein [Campylobacter coli]